MKEAIILAGGMGTRLKGVVSDMPKPMAPIGDKPFLTIIFDFLQRHNVDRAILSVGYKYEVIKDYYGDNYKGIELVYSVEETPLGTGGAIQLALSHVKGDAVVILNGDSYVDVDVQDFSKAFSSSDSKFGMVIKEMTNFDRYGTVITEGDRITSFQEKRALDRGYINTGVYILDKAYLLSLNLSEKFSFENDFMEKYYAKSAFFAYTTDGFFIDIGIPEDYRRAQTEFK